MSKKERKPIEIIVSRYWPTKIIKSVEINDPNSEYNQNIKLVASEARYVYDLLKELYEPAPKAPKGTAGDNDG